MVKPEEVREFLVEWLGKEKRLQVVAPPEIVVRVAAVKAFTDLAPAILNAPTKWNAMWVYNFFVALTGLPRIDPKLGWGIDDLNTILEVAKRLEGAFVKPAGKTVNGKKIVSFSKMAATTTDIVFKKTLEGIADQDLHHVSVISYIQTEIFESETFSDEQKVLFAIAMVDEVKTVEMQHAEALEMLLVYLGQLTGKLKVGVKKSEGKPVPPIDWL